MKSIFKKLIIYFKLGLGLSLCNQNSFWYAKSNKCINIYEECSCNLNQCTLECENGYEKDNNQC